MRRYRGRSGRRAMGKVDARQAQRRVVHALGDDPLSQIDGVIPAKGIGLRSKTRVHGAVVIIDESLPRLHVEIEEVCA